MATWEALLQETTDCGKDLKQGHRKLSMEWIVDWQRGRVGGNAVELWLRSLGVALKTHGDYLAFLKIGALRQFFLFTVEMRGASNTGNFEAGQNTCCSAYSTKKKVFQCPEDKMHVSVFGP